MSSKRTFYRIFSTSFDKRKLILGKRGGVETEYGYFSRRKGTQEETWERHLSCRPRSCRCKDCVNKSGKIASGGFLTFPQMRRGCRTLSVRQPLQNITRRSSIGFRRTHTGIPVFYDRVHQLQRDLAAPFQGIVLVAAPCDAQSRTVKGHSRAMLGGSTNDGVSFSCVCIQFCRSCHRINLWLDDRIRINYRKCLQHGTEPVSMSFFCF